MTDSSTAHSQVPDADNRVFLGVEDPTSERRLSGLLEQLDCAVTSTLPEAVPEETGPVPQPAEALDLLLVDPPTLRGRADDIEALRAATAPAYLPLGVLVSERGSVPDAERVVESIETEGLPAPDEVFVLPVGKREFARRLGVLLRARRLSAELAATSHQYERLLELTPESILVLRDGAVVYANDVATDLFGEAVVGASLDSFLAPDGGRSTSELLAAVTDPEERFVQVDFLIDGEEVHAEAAGVEITYEGAPATQVVLRDLTDRERRERRLRLFERTMDEAGIGITIADARLPDEPLIYANDHFVELTGYALGEVLGRNCRFLQGPSTDPEPVREMREAIAAGEPVSVELRNYRADGTPFWNAVTITPVRDADGEVTHFVGFQQDVTARKQRQQRLSVLDRVLRHNLRNAMTVIEGNAAAVADRHDDERTQDNVAAIREASDDLLAMSDAARTFERLATLDNIDATEQVDLSSTVGSAVAAAEHRYPDVTVSTDIPEWAVARCHPAVKNALEELIETIAGASGTVAVEATDTDDGWVRLSIGDLGESAPDQEALVISDDTESSLEHLSGIAVWLVKWSVEASGGEIEFDHDGPMTCLVARLPADDGE